MSQIHSLQLPGTLFVLPEVSLAANQDDWRVPTEVLHLWVPLGKQNREFNGVIQYMSVISPLFVCSTDWSCIVILAHMKACTT